MEVSLIPDAAVQGLSFAKFLLRNPHSSASYPLSAVSDAGSDPFHGAGTRTISCAALPTDAVAPPTVRYKIPLSVPRTLTRRLRRTRKRSTTDGSDDGDGDGFFGSGDGPFGGGGGGRWNSDGSGGSNWEGSSPPYSDPAFDFVYEVLCWIVLLHCLHFSFKRIGDLFREKVSVRLAPSVC